MHQRQSPCARPMISPVGPDENSTGTSDMITGHRCRENQQNAKSRHRAGSRIHTNVTVIGLRAARVGVPRRHGSPSMPRHDLRAPPPAGPPAGRPATASRANPAVRDSRMPAAPAPASARPCPAPARARARSSVSRSRATSDAGSTQARARSTPMRRSSADQSARLSSFRSMLKRLGPTLRTPRRRRPCRAAARRDGRDDRRPATAGRRAPSPHGERPSRAPPSPRSGDAPQHDPDSATTAASRTMLSPQLPGRGAQEP